MSSPRSGAAVARPRVPGSRFVGHRVELFRTYWSRHAPGRPTPPHVLTEIYRWWLAACTLKVLGASWDISWHFKWLRDEFAPPHLLNTVGTVIAVVLVVIQGYTGLAGDRRTIRLLQWGMGIFLVAMPLDAINHKVNGLDITTWSLSHFLLFLGTGIMIAGVVRGWRAGAPTARGRTVVLGAFWLFFLENVYFPNGHQEYGVMEIASWDRGHPFAEPSLLRFAAGQIGRPVDRPSLLNFALPIPSWVYPFYAVVGAMLVLVLARVSVGRRWTATAIAGAYVLYRCLIWPVLAGTGFPTSAVPFFLLAGAVVIDLAYLARMPRYARAAAGAVVVTAAVYGGLALQSVVAVAPPVAYWPAPLTAVVFAAAWLVAARVARGGLWTPPSDDGRPAEHEADAVRQAHDGDLAAGPAVDGGPAAADDGGQQPEAEMRAEPAQ